MRTTVTLEPDVADRLRGVMDQSGVTSRQAVNEALRAGLSMSSPSRFVQRSHSPGWRPGVDHERAAVGRPHAGQ